MTFQFVAMFKDRKNETHVNVYEIKKDGRPEDIVFWREVLKRIKKDIEESEIALDLRSLYGNDIFR